jgi:murein DD-endopeptidase MepM/ murein hydrolase activator NlpD
MANGPHRPRPGRRIRQPRRGLPVGLVRRSGQSHQGGYYSLDGKALKKAFLKSPLEFTRISSGFSMRVHPMFNVWKAHKGIDMAAPMGTPIRAAGDGTVDFAGVSNGYGNMVVLKHWSNYSTAYGHMSRFATGMRKGQQGHARAT